MITDKSWKEILDIFDGKVDRTTLPTHEDLLSRLCGVVRNYATEIARDAIEGYGADVLRGGIGATVDAVYEKENWSNAKEAELALGHLLLLVGKAEEAEAHFRKAYRIHQENIEDAYSPLSDSLSFIVNSLTDLGYTDRLEHWQTELNATLANERHKKKRKISEDGLKRKIVKLEADMECAVGGDLDDIINSTRKRQAEIFFKMRNYNGAIEYADKAINAYLECPTEHYFDAQVIKIKSYVKLKDFDSARKELLAILTHLMPNDIAEGEELPQEFRKYFTKLVPLFQRLGAGDNIGKVLRYANTRLDKLLALARSDKLGKDKEEETNSRELHDLVEILTFLYVAEEKYEEASRVIDNATEVGAKLKYPPRFDYLTQATYLFEAGEYDQITDLISCAAHKCNDNFFDLFNGGKNVFNATALYLGVGEYNKALGLLDAASARLKKGLMRGTFKPIYSARRVQIDISSRLLGSGAVDEIRKYFAAQAEPIVVGDAPLALPDATK